MQLVTHQKNKACLKANAIGSESPPKIAVARTCGGPTSSAWTLVGTFPP